MVLPTDDLERVLCQRFGYQRFRPGQRRAIQTLLNGRDVLAIFPTGAGKSLVYQLAAQLLPGATLVVSPLLALMKDQQDALLERGLQVSAINSTLSEREAAEALQAVQAGQAKLLYVTPERFDDADFVAAMSSVDVSLLVVDEAHCISEWGHSFRPSYLNLGESARRLGRPTLLALTATATPWVRADIIDRLGMHEPSVVVRGIDRPNLFLEVVRVEEEREDKRVLHHLLCPDSAAATDTDAPAPGLAAAMGGCGIVYCATTRSAQETAAWLREWGIAADYYHGQRRKADRARVQDAFMAGALRVITATNAFGMGIDKPDIRFVIHRDIPANLEAYYQEAGRAGRDGELARCTLIYRPGDVGRAAFLSATSQLSRDAVVLAWASLRAKPRLSLGELQEATRTSRGDALRLAETLAAAGVVRAARGRLRLLVDDFDPQTISLEQEERRRAYERSRLEMMRGYAEARGCRRAYVLSYFGEVEPVERCGQCDNDTHVGPLPAAEPVEPAAEVVLPFGPRDRVRHPGWGEGTVQRIAGETVTVLFDSVGYKTLATELVLEQDLLTRSSPAV